jgi:hypothetical protein
LPYLIKVAAANISTKKDIASIETISQAISNSQITSPSCNSQQQLSRMLRILLNHKQQRKCRSKP